MDGKQITNAIEKEYILSLLKQGRRLDGRGINEFRELKIETNVIGTANGSAIVYLGKTKLICGIKATISNPWPEYPNKGSIFVGIETSPLSAPEYRVGPPQIDEIELSRVTDRAIRESECIDLEDLCIIPGEKVWTLNIDIYTLDDYGNLFDASVIAAYAALYTARIPEVRVIDGEIEILETTRPIKLNTFPISVTTYKIGEYLVTDAELREEQIADARITFGTIDTHIISGQKGGSGAFKSSEILEILKTAIRTGSELRNRVKDILENNS